MTLDNATLFADNSPERAALQHAQRLVSAKGTTSRKHFLDAYAEHLEALKRDRLAAQR